MSVLIVEGDPELADLWARHLQRRGTEVHVARETDTACRTLSDKTIDVLVIDLDLEGGGALTVADFASYRRPDARVIFVTATTFFSDGSIFRLIPNAAGYLAADARPEDLAALVEHHSRCAVAQEDKVPDPSEALDKVDCPAGALPEVEHDL